MVGSYKGGVCGSGGKYQALFTTYSCLGSSRFVTSSLLHLHAVSCHADLPFPINAVLNDELSRPASQSLTLVLPVGFF